MNALPLRRPQLPLALRGLNAAGAALARIGLFETRLDEDSLCAAACSKTGFSDFGDERFRIGLRDQIEAQDLFERMHFLGIQIARYVIRRSLRNRLLIEQRLKEHPEVLQVQVPRPLVIAGLGRTGTTLLMNLLAQDPAARPLLFWEATAPAALPRKRSARDLRAKQARLLARLGKYVLPQVAAINPFDPEGPMECGPLFRNAFLLPGFGQDILHWLKTLPQERLEWAYGQYHRQLKLLEWARPAPGHWILKWPLHLIATETLLKTLPDVSIIQTHRDPCQVMASHCQVAQILTVFFGDERWAAFPREMLSLVGEALRRSVDARQRIPDSRIFDIHFRRLVAEPIAVLRDVYDHFGYPYTDEFEQRARAWLEANPAPKRERKYHDLEQFGLTRDEVEKQFDFYSQYYGLKAGARQ